MSLSRPKKQPFLCKSFLDVHMNFIIKIYYGCSSNLCFGSAINYVTALNGYGVTIFVTTLQCLSTKNCDYENEGKGKYDLKLCDVIYELPQKYTALSVKSKSNLYTFINTYTFTHLHPTYREIVLLNVKTLHQRQH